MRSERIHDLLHRFERGELTASELVDRLDGEPVENLGFARIDHHRSLRLGYPEAVYCEGKTADQVAAICARMAERGEGFLATRTSAEMRRRLAAEHPDAELNDLGRTVHLPPGDRLDPKMLGRVLVVSAGTSDLPVAEEAAVAAAAMGNPIDRLDDVGVAGIHRVLAARGELKGAAVIIVVAGMEAALASVIGGLVPTPVVAVPTSVGYGASFGGLAALLGLLNSCAPGVLVVNIDNGYGAAAAATRINRLAARPAD